MLIPKTNKKHKTSDASGNSLNIEEKHFNARNMKRKMTSDNRQLSQNIENLF